LTSQQRLYTDGENTVCIYSTYLIGICIPYIAMYRTQVRTSIGQRMAAAQVRSETDISQSETDISRSTTDISQSTTDSSQSKPDISQSETDSSDSLQLNFPSLQLTFLGMYVRSGWRCSRGYSTQLVRARNLSFRLRNRYIFFCHLFWVIFGHFWVIV